MTAPAGVGSYPIAPKSPKRGFSTPDAAARLGSIELNWPSDLGDWADFRMNANPVLRRFGLDESDRAVVSHADDVGMCQATVGAFVDLVEAGIVSSTAVMAPCPWFPLAAAGGREHPAADVGVHLTLNCEWGAIRWGPIPTRDPASGLLDADGYSPRPVVGGLHQAYRRAA